MLEYGNKILEPGHPNCRRHNWLIYLRLHSLLRKHAPLFRGTVVDLGCGSSHYRQFLLKFCDKYVGVDWPQSLHDSHPDVVSDLNRNIALPDAFADTVLAISVMEHLYAPAAFLRETFRITKPGGVFFLQAPFQWLVHEQPNDYLRFTGWGLKYLLEEAGFREITIEPLGGVFSSIALKTNYFSLRWAQTGVARRIGAEGVLRTILTPLWTISQITALVLDRLDGWPEAETAGLVAVCRKGP